MLRRDCESRRVPCPRLGEPLADLAEVADLAVPQPAVALEVIAVAVRKFTRAMHLVRLRPTWESA